MVKKIIALAFCFLAAFSHAAQDAREARKIGVQTFTFAKMTLEELLPAVRECGCGAVGLSRHRLSDKFPGAYVSPDMSAEQKAFLKKILAQNKIKAVSYGVATPASEKAVRKLMKFAREIGAGVVIAEPRPEALPLWDALCAEYGLKVAVHNHAKDAKRNAEYHDPNFVADMIKNFPRVFACPDTGHWGRSGVNCASGLKTLSGKIAIVHFRDINKFGSLSAYDVPLGTGELGAKEMLAELDAQKFGGYLLLEYGGWWKNSPEQKMSELKRCVEFLKNN